MPSAGEGPLRAWSSCSLRGGSKLSMPIFTGQAGKSLMVYLPRRMYAEATSCLPTSLLNVMRPSDTGSPLNVTSPVISPFPPPQPARSNSPAGASHTASLPNGLVLAFPFCVIPPPPSRVWWLVFTLSQTPGPNLPVGAEYVVAVGCAGGPPRRAAETGVDEPDTAIPQADVHAAGVARLGHGRVAHRLVRVGLDLKLGPGADLSGRAPAGVEGEIGLVAQGAIAAAEDEARHVVLIPVAVAPQGVEGTAGRVLLGEENRVAGAIGEGGRDLGEALHIALVVRVPDIRVAEDLIVGPVAPEGPPPAPGLPIAVGGVSRALQDLGRLGDDRARVYLGALAPRIGVGVEFVERVLLQERQQPVEDVAVARRRGKGAAHGRQPGFLVVAVVRGNGELMEVVLALDAGGRLTDLLDSGEEQADEDGYDRY